MNPKPDAVQIEQPESTPPSPRQQVVMTIKVLAVTGAVLGAIWILDLLAAQ